MNKRSKLLVVGAASVVLAAAGGGIALAGSGGGDDAEAPISGAALDRASAVALDHVGNGKVTDTEVGDEESLYEVEVTRDGGGEVDVQLDGDFKVVGQESEDSERDDD